MQTSFFDRALTLSLTLLAVVLAPPSSAAEAPASAVDLLAAYSGRSAAGFAPFFRYSADARIVRVEIHAVGTERTTARYSGREAAWKEVNNVLRITTADGFEGVSGVDSYYQGPFSDAHLRELRGVAAEVIALRSLDPVEVQRALGRVRPDLSDPVRASIDIALWDLAARRAGRPLYRMLGDRRESIEAYASLPFYETLGEYSAAVSEYAASGYRTFKFHVWGRLDRDLALVDTIQREFAESGYRFMIDLESAYDLADALRLGEKMDDGLFIWFEAPLDDARLGDYAALRRRLGVSIIPAGYTHYSAAFLRQGIDAGAWDAGRFDATVVGGISRSLELLMIANEAGLPIEIQSWGHALSQAANLHLMLANDLTAYFEAPMPAAAFEFGMKNGNPSGRGRVAAADGPGLGIRVDWDRLAEADFYVRSILDESEVPAK